MDLTTTTTTTSDPTENETPPHLLSIKSKSFTNGSTLNHLHHHPPPPTVTIFKECLKNHAASLGAHALDGCGEFMPSPTATPTDPTSLTCAACGCHRNFHRRESDNPAAATHFLEFRRRRSSPSPPPLPYAPHMLLALRTAAAPEDHHHHQQHAVATPATPTALKAENSSGRKRFRTKFSQEQKDKMLSFAEKLGWKMQKSDEDLVEKFCNEIGIGKGVLKVWLHNNKSTLGKRSDTINNNISNGRINSFDDNTVNCDDHQPQNEISGSGVTVDHRHLHVSTNGSSSSS